MKLTKDQREAHEHALSTSRRLRKDGWEAIAALQRVIKTGAHEALKYKNIFIYSRKALSLTREEAYMYKAVAERALELPALQKILREQKLSVNLAGRMMSTINKDNADALITFALTHTQEELNAEVARLNPKAKKRASVRYISGEEGRVAFDAKKVDIENARRGQALMATDMGEAYAKAMAFWLEHHDPVRRAQRAKAKKDVKAAGAVSNRKSDPKKQKYPSAEQIHEVVLRDEGRCTEVDDSGTRCNDDRWLQVHHIVPLSEGGTNEPSNLRMLCAAHHAMLHKKREDKAAARLALEKKRKMAAAGNGARPQP